MNLSEIMQAAYHKDLAACSNAEIYAALLTKVQKMA